jgi:hypothetical protein
MADEIVDLGKVRESKAKKFEKVIANTWTASGADGKSFG